MRHRNTSFTPDWYFIGRGSSMHYIEDSGFKCYSRISACGIHAEKERIYSGTSTTHCQVCLKIRASKHRSVARLS